LTDEKILNISSIFEKLKIELCILTETHWIGNDITSFGEWRIHHSGSTSGTRERGVAVMIRSRDSKDVEFEAISERVFLCHIPHRTITLVGVYVPTDSGYSSEEKEEFFITLQEHIEKATVEAEKRRFELVIGGDFNCRLNRTDENEKTVGCYTSSKVTSENGELLIDLAEACNLRIENTFYKHKLTQRTSWTHPATKRRLLLDLFLVQKSRCNRIRNVKSYPNFDCGSDHDLVVLTILVNNNKPLKLTNDRKKKSKGKVDRFSLQNNKEAISAEIGRKCPDIESWDDLEKTVTSTMDKHRKKKVPLNQRWLHGHLEELKPLLQEKWKRRREYVQNRCERTYSIWKAARLNTLRMLRRWKRERIESIGQEIEGILNRECMGKTSELYMELRVLCDSETKESSLCSVQSSVKDEVLAEHFSNLFKKNEGDYVMDLEQSQQLDINYLPDVEEVGAAIKQLKNGTAAGNNGIIPELFKWGGHQLTIKIMQCFEAIWEGRAEFPEAWKTAKVVILYKGKGSKKDLNNYRGIFLLDVGGKIMARIIANRLIPHLERILDDWQFGFRPKRSTAQAIGIIRKIQEEARYRSKNIYAIFIDLEKAFDSVPRKVLWDCLQGIGVQGHMLNVIMKFHENFTGSIGKEAFQMDKGVRQGCVLGPLLFNLVFDCAIKTAVKDGLSGGVKVLHNGVELLVNRLAYADDLCLLDEDYGNIEKNLTCLNTAFKRMGLKINIGKTKILNLNGARYITARDELNAGIEWVDEFCYLGSIIESRGGSGTDIKTRIKKGTIKLRTIRPVLKNNKLSLRNKRNIISSCVFPVVYYSCENWRTNVDHVKKLKAFHNLCTRRTLGISKAERIRMDELSIGLQSPMDILARRRLNHNIKIELGVCPDNVKQVYECELIGGKKVSGRRKQHLAECLRVDTHWLFGDNYSVEEFKRDIQLENLSTTDAKMEKIYRLKKISRSGDEKTLRLVLPRLKEHSCPMDACYKQYAEVKELNRHLRRDHEGADPIPRKQREKKAQPRQKKGVYKCLQCPKEYKTAGFLKIHIQKNHREESEQPNAQQEDNLVIVREEEPTTIQSNPQLPEATMGTPRIQTEDNTTYTREESPHRQYRLPANYAKAKGHFQCPFRGCYASTVTAKGMYGHGTKFHGWSFATGKPIARRQKDTDPVGGLSGGP